MSDFQKELRRGERLLYVFMAMPLLIFVAIYAGGYIPPTWRNLYYLGAAVALLSFIVVTPVREHLRSERRAGFVPKRPGFSGKLELAAEKLREHASLVEEEGPEAGSAPMLDSYLTELRRVARSQDQHDLVPGLVLECRGNATAHASRLRQAASELEQYAHRVRRKGGIFHLSGVQRIYGAAIVAAMFGWGAWLMAATWSTPSFTFFGGALLVAFAILFGVGLVRSLEDADATRR